jgi:hypothetical protein
MDRDRAPPSAATEPTAAAAPRRALPDELRGQLERSYAADLSAIRVVEDGTAEQLGKLAAARGADLHFACGAYDPVGDAGRRVIAHEVAHAVQQGAAPTVGVPAVADADVALEDEAHRAAAAALAGAPAKLSRGRAAVGFQGWTSPEHDLVEVIAGQVRPYHCNGLVLTPRDFAALTGDYFDVFATPRSDLIDLASTPSPSPGQVPGTRDEVLAAIADYNPHDFRVQGLVFSDAVKTAVRQRFNAAAVHNSTHFAQPNLVAGKLTGSAGNTYRRIHEQAIETSHRGDVGKAHAYDAMADHYLTDAFAAGHIRTPRADVQTYWNQVVPAFKTNLVDVLAARVRRELTGDLSLARVVLGAFDVAAEAMVLHARVRSELLDAFGTDGIPGLGDLLALLLHDTDNEEGLLVENDVGMRWRAYGDGKLFAGAGQLDPLVEAVRVGHDDIDRAYAMRGSPYDEVIGALKAPGTDRYAAERLMPRAVPDANGNQNWRAPSFDELIAKPVRDDRPAISYLAALQRACRPGGAIYQMVASASSEIEEVSLGGLYEPRKAFEDGVLAALRSDPVGLLDEIIAG